jgi:hypothetical protein
MQPPPEIRCTGLLLWGIALVVKMSRRRFSSHHLNPPDLDRNELPLKKFFGWEDARSGLRVIMALILRRTDISHAPAYEGLEDYTVYDDEDQPVGRIYRPHAPANPGYEPHSPAGRELTVGGIYRPPAPEPHGRELTWFWSITVPVDPKFRIRTHGHAETLERAHAEFQANWDARF